MHEDPIIGARNVKRGLQFKNTEAKDGDDEMKGLGTQKPQYGSLNFYEYGLI